MYAYRRRLPTTLSARLERNVCPEPNTGCWLWTGGQTTDGYGVLKFRAVNLRAHRASWEAHRGPIPHGMLVLHRCDTPACINPDHLWLGVDRDNSVDRERKGRGRWSKELV